MSLRPGSCMVYRCRADESVMLNDLGSLLVCRDHAEQLGEVFTDDNDQLRCDMDPERIVGWRLVMRLTSPDIAVLYPPGVGGPS